MTDAERVKVVAEVLEEDMYVVRLYDMMDGWIDVSGPLTSSAAVELWRQKTDGGTKNVRYEDGDYYKVFPAGTKMLVTPEYLGR